MAWWTELRRPAIRERARERRGDGNGKRYRPRELGQRLHKLHHQGCRHWKRGTFGDEGIAHHCNANAGPYFNADSSTHADSDTDTDPDSNAGPHFNADSDTDPDPNADPHFNADSSAHTDCDTDPDSNAGPHLNPDSSAHAAHTLRLAASQRTH